MDTVPTGHLKQELDDLRLRLIEAEDTLRAIRQGEVDAIVVDGSDGSKVFTLKSADEPYRLLVEQMRDGAATVAPDGLILYCNRRFAEILRARPEALVGRRVQDFAGPAAGTVLGALLTAPERASGGRDLDLSAADGSPVSLHVSVSGFTVEGSDLRCVILTDLTWQEARARLAGIVEHSDDAILGIGPDDEVTSWNLGAGRLFGYAFSEIAGQPLANVVSPERTGEHESVLRQVRETATAMRLETVWRRKDGQPVDVALTISPIRGELAVVTGLSCIARDITERKRAEKQQLLLSAELDHRVKNILATVQSLVANSQRGSKTVADFVERLQGRLAAKARVHDLLTGAQWEGVSLGDLLRRELVPYGGGDEDTVSLTGPEIVLQPAAAISLTMVIHELTTNTAKHGALSAAGGRIDVTWTVKPAAGENEDRLVLVWSERGGPAVSPPTRQGFGSILLERGPQYELGGQSRLEFAAEGLRYEMEAPLSEIGRRSGLLPLTRPSPPTPRKSRRAPRRQRRILVVEDDFLVAAEMTSALEAIGFSVVGPVGQIDQALAVARKERLDGAVLDVNLHGAPVYPIADLLIGRKVPLVFSTGYDNAVLPAKFRALPRLEKPFTNESLKVLATAVFG